MNIVQTTGLPRPSIARLGLLALCLVTILAAPTVHARLSETRAQIEARYGKALTQQDDKETPGLCRCRYEHDGMSVGVVYIQGTCYAETYTRMNGKMPLSNDEVRVLLDANRFGFAWMDDQQAGDARENPLIELPDGKSIGHPPDCSFNPNATGWNLCNPSVHFQRMAVASWEDAKDGAGGTLSIVSTSLSTYIDAVRDARVKAALKGF